VLDVNTDIGSSYGQDYDPVTWRVGAVYSVRPDKQLFAQFTSAALPVSSLLFMNATNASFDVSTGESFEVGAKMSFLDSRLELTASLFDIRQDDIVTRDPNNPAVTIQGGRQSSKGGELALKWKATDELTVELGGTLLTAQFDKLIEAGGADRSGNRPLNVPEQLIDLVVSYAPRTWPVTFTGIVRHNGAFYTSNANDIRVDAFTVVD